jgi:hypothetical protein
MQSKAARVSQDPKGQTLASAIWLGIVLFLGCTQTSELKPIPQEVGKDIQSGRPLSELKSKLGEPHSPTARQAQMLANTIANMPEPMRTNATNDKSVAWGNDRGFVVGKMNDREIVWVVCWSSQ